MAAAATAGTAAGVGRLLSTERGETPPAASSGGDAAEHLPRNLTWSVFKNTTVQAVARVILMAAKLLMYGIIIRTYGLESFGRYALVLVTLAFAETAADFGLNEIFVREMCQRPRERGAILGSLRRARVLQCLVAYALLGAALGVMAASFSWPAEILQACLIGGLGVFFFARILVYRAVFTVTLTMEREVGSEILSTILSIGLVALGCALNLGLLGLVVPLVIGRAAFFGLVRLLGRREMAGFAAGGGGARPIGPGYRAALPIGLTILLVCANHSLGPVLLEHLADTRTVGIYSAAYRFGLPFIMIVAAFAASLYPVFASYWGSRMDELRKTFQIGLDSVVVAAGALIVVLSGAADFLMGLLDVREAGPVMRVLAVAFALMSLSTVVAPLLFIVGRRWFAFFFSLATVSINVVLEVLLIPKLGEVGAAWSALVAEAVGALIPTIAVVLVSIRHRPRLAVPVKAALCVVAALVAAGAITRSGSLLCGVLALALYAAGALLVGAARLDQIRALLGAVRQRIART